VARHGSVVVNGDGVYFPDRTIPVCDILIEGHRVLSMLPSKQEKMLLGKALIEWPRRLKPFLRGTGHVIVREHGSGIVHHDAEIQFDGSDVRSSVVDAEGRQLIMSKWGDMTHSFDDSDDIDEQIKMTARLLRDLHEIGVPGYVAYGTLLGAVRSGKVIGHDSDTDVSYLSAHEHPADIALESFFVQRGLRTRGWKLERSRLGKLKVIELHKCDIFVSYFYGDKYYLDQWAEGPMRREQILPLSTVTIEGHELPAPAEPADVLELNYGPNWGTPDPSFRYDINAPHLARVRGWFGGHTTNKLAWNRFWGDPEMATRRPSPFAAWVAERIDRTATLIDLGCGDGTDTISLARLGIRAVGWDYAGQALVKARRAAAGLTPKPRFRKVSIADTRVSLAEGALIAAMPGPKTVTARLVLDTLTFDGYVNFWQLLRLLMARGDMAYLEFRAKPNRPLAGYPLGLWSGVVDVRDVRRRIEAIGGEITEEEVKRSPGLAGIVAPVRRIAVRFEPKV
jgi:hypothetical protein